MPAKPLSSMQKELVIEYLLSLDRPFTNEDLATRWDVHEQTSRLWISQLRNEGVIADHPMRLGRKLQFVLSMEGTGRVDVDDPELRAVRVVQGKEQVTPAQWSRGNLQNSSVVLGAAVMQYLFVRSYYADSPDHQHLRGTVSPVEARAFFAELIKDLEANLEVMRQLLAYNAPWIEGGDFARRFGMMDNLAASMGVATQVEAKITEWKAAKK